MSDTKIEWASKVWNPIVGCSVTSPGCTNCYAVVDAQPVFREARGTILKYHWRLGLRCREGALVQRTPGRGAAKGSAVMTNEPPTPVYTVNGKEVLCDGKHFADFRDADAARAVCTLLNCQEVLHEPGTSDDELDHMVAVLWG